MFNLCAADGGLCDNPAADENEDTANADHPQGDPARHRPAGDRQGGRARNHDRATRLVDEPRSELSRRRRRPHHRLRPGDGQLDARRRRRHADRPSAAPPRTARTIAPPRTAPASSSTSAPPATTRCASTVESMIRADLAKIGINVPAAFEPNVAGGDILRRRSPMAARSRRMRSTWRSTPSGSGFPASPIRYSSIWHGDCGGACLNADAIPSSANLGVGMNFSGLNDAQLDSDLDLARNSADLTARAQDYALADQRLAALLPAIPLYPAGHRQHLLVEPARRRAERSRP